MHTRYQQLVEAYETISEATRLSAADKQEIIKHAHKIYDEISGDLHSTIQDNRKYGLFGSFYDAAHDHISDRLYDQFHQKHPGFNFRNITKQALKGVVWDDRKEDRELERAYKKAKNKKPKTIRQPKVKKTWWQDMGLKKKPVRGLVGGKR